MKKRSVITMEINGALYYAMDSHGSCWSDEINDVKMFHGMARAKEKYIKERFENDLQSNCCDVTLKTNGVWDCQNRVTLSRNNVNTVLLHELFLSI